MTLKIESILEISNKYDAIVFDQYGVLHDGKIPYLGAIECLSTFKKNWPKVSSSFKLRKAK